VALSLGFRRVELSLDHRCSVVSGLSSNVSFGQILFETRPLRSAVQSGSEVTPATVWLADAYAFILGTRSNSDNKLQVRFCSKERDNLRSLLAGPQLHDASEHSDDRSDHRGVGAADRLVGVVFRLQADVVRLAEEALHGGFVLDHRDDDFAVTRRLR